MSEPEWSKGEELLEAVDSTEAAMRKKIMFMVDDWPYWVKASVIWSCCRIFGHEMITMCKCGPSCAWCGK